MREQEKMSVVEDVRKALQDFLTPELRELKARLDSIEKSVISMNTNLNQRFDQMETLLNFNARLTRLETIVKDQPHQ